MSFNILSNDLNPIHINEEYTYNTIFGKPIYHGIHLVLLAFEKSYLHKCKFEYISCIFHNFIHLSDVINFEHSTNKILIKKNTILCVEINYKTIEKSDKLVDNSRKNILSKPKIDFFPTLYTYNMHIDVQELQRLFPNIYEHMDTLQIFQMINLSRFVGMYSPGLYSIFNSFEFINTNSDEVEKYNMFFKKIDKNETSVNYSYEGFNCKGNILAFIRPKNIEYTPYPSIKTKKFENQHVLIVGGSQGIGESLAKLYYENGAKITITYYKNKERAEQVKNDKIDILCYKVGDDIQDNNYTHLCYMATSPIYTKGFDITLYEEYYFYYITGFLKVFNSLKNLKYVFYPSTQDIENKISLYPEYTEVKTLAEKMIKNLQQQYKINFHIERLPRLQTNRTNSVINVGIDSYTYLRKLFNNIYILTASNIDFVLKEIKTSYTIEYTSFNQLYQVLQKPIEADYVFNLCTIEDILNEQYFYMDRTEYRNRIDDFVERLKTIKNLYCVKAFQRHLSVFDNTNKSPSLLIEYYNNKLKELNVPLIDINIEKKFDKDMYNIGKYSYSLEASKYIAKYINYLTNTIEPIKCIIVDLDNTLWKGVIAEGEIYTDEKWFTFHRILKSYKDRGIILCIVSKNDLENAKKGFNLLSNIDFEDFIMYRINWNTKSQNILDICKELNIRSENVLFIDDSPIEREEVRQNCKCQILDIKEINPEHYIELLLQNINLITFSITDSDLTKFELYKSKQKIESEKLLHTNLTDFYSSLNTIIDFKENKERAIQLMKKTNQFNLNKEYVPNPNDIIILLTYSDKYTKYDEAGVIVYENKDDFIIKNIVLSCRVFNRDFETCIFTFIKNIANNKKIIGTIKKTELNKNFHDIYEKFGFVNLILVDYKKEEYPKYFSIKGKEDKKLYDVILELENVDNLNYFTDILDFNSLKFMYLLSRLRNRFPELNIEVKHFYDDLGRMISVRDFCNNFEK